MAYRFDIVHRIEPRHDFTDFGGQLAARTADPVWFLGRQWQIGEHRGDDAASPVRVAYRAEQVPIDPVGGNRGPDPRAVPAEAIVEAEPDGGFWTIGRRVTVGRSVARLAADAGRPLPAGDDRTVLSGLPIPYDVLNGTGFDGRSLSRDRERLELPDEWFAEVPPRTTDHWNSTELSYDADFTAGPGRLALRRHDGGTLDWWSVDAAAPLPERPAQPDPETAFPSPVRYPGAPHSRWWEIEDVRVDFGAYGPDRGRFAALLLVELVSSHSDDWFTFPVAAQAGHVLTLREVRVFDSTGTDWTLEPPGDGWTLFSVTGLDERSLVLWATVPTALAGPVLDQVDLGHDEDANLVWAVERRVEGVDVATPARPAPAAAPPDGDAAAPLVYRYEPVSEVPPSWHPYPVEDTAPGEPRRLIQGRLLDTDLRRMPLPVTRLLRPTPAGGGGAVHRIDPAAVPVDGLQLERRDMLARRTDGLPVLWTQRRRLPLAAPPTMRLRFDTLAVDGPPP